MESCGSEHSSLSSYFGNETRQGELFFNNTRETHRTVKKRLQNNFFVHVVTFTCLVY